MTKEYIERDALLSDIEETVRFSGDTRRMLMEARGANKVISRIREAHAADVVSGEEYDRLLEIARKLHTWIFLHVADEEKAYDEIGLSLADNLLLGYSGSLEFEVIRKEGVDNA